MGASLSQLRPQIFRKSYINLQGDLKMSLLDAFRPRALYIYLRPRGLPRWLCGKESACQCRRLRRCECNPWVEKIPWSMKWQPALALLPEKFQEQRSLAGYSPLGHKKLDTTERLSTYASRYAAVACGSPARM